MFSRILPSSGSKHGKSSQRSPKAADIRFKSYRIDNGAEPPQVSLDGLSTPSIPEAEPSSPPPSVPSVTLDTSRAAHPDTGASTSNMSLTTSPQMWTPNRITSNPRHNFTSPLAPPPTDPSSSPSSPNGEGGDSPAWSGAVGRASLGKSGRMIERLMGDIDKLKRELNAEISHRQELSKRDEVNRSTEDALRTENSNLQQAKEVDAALLKRRDRMIEDLKSELSDEKERRVRAETRATTETRKREDTEIQCRKDVTEAREIAKHATGHAEVLMQSHKQLRGEYKQRASTFTGDLHKLQTDREDDRTKVQKLGAVVNNLQHEIQRRDRSAEQMSQAFDRYQRESDERFEKYVERKEREVQKLKDQAEAYEMIERDFEEVKSEARWLIGLGKVAQANSDGANNKSKA